MSIGTRIRRAREAEGISQVRLAEVMGVTRSAVSQWEREEARPRPDHFTQLARILGVSEEWLASGRSGGSLHTGDTTPPYAGDLADDERELLRLYARLDKTGRDALLVLLRQSV